MPDEREAVPPGQSCQGSSSRLDARPPPPQEKVPPMKSSDLPGRGCRGGAPQGLWG